jgi:methylamine methyltransferase corrinoid protein reductive activase
MPRYGIALDLGTSGFRGQAIDLESGEILSTVITSRHPLPGANIMDQMTFAIEAGPEITHDIFISAVNQVISALGVPRESCERLAVCGNPIQLSLFEEIEIRDLAYAGENKKRLLGVQSPNRDAKVKSAREIRNLELPAHCTVSIPPAVRHEIGADALALMVKSGMLEKDEISLAVDYGTNAEMALKVGNKIITGSSAAGPALEGQQISRGMLAAPGAVSDINAEGAFWRCVVLNDAMMPAEGPLIDLDGGTVKEPGSVTPLGITGTGVIALLNQGMEDGFIKLPRILTSEKTLGIGFGITFTEADLIEAGKAIGAIRAGYLTLAKEAGIEVSQIKSAYMAGASGTYVDAKKAFSIGMVPPKVKAIYQIGNTSLSLAKDIVLNPVLLGELQDLTKNLRANHCMFAESDAFQKAYLLELSYWGEGMPWEQYQRFIGIYGLPALPPTAMSVDVKKVVPRDIVELGREGLRVIDKVGIECSYTLTDCAACKECVRACPEKALSMEMVNDEVALNLRMDRCNGTACLRCERACPRGSLRFIDLCFKGMGNPKSSPV